MIIITDRNKKKANFDKDWTDAMGVEETKREKARTLEVDPNAGNPVDTFICENSAKDLMGRKVWCLNDRDQMFEGWVRDVYPSRMLLIKINGKNHPYEFERIVSIGDR